MSKKQKGPELANETADIGPKLQPLANGPVVPEGAVVPEGYRLMRKRQPGPREKIDPELRSYYAVLGVSKQTGETTWLGRFKSKKGAERWCESSRALMRPSFSRCWVVRVRQVRAFEL